MGNVYVLRKQNETSIQVGSDGTPNIQYQIGTGKGMTSPLKFLPYLAGGYGALRSLASRDQTDLGSALASAGMSALTNYSTFNQLGAGAERLFRDKFGRVKEAPPPDTSDMTMMEALQMARGVDSNTTQMPADNTGNTVAENLKVDPVLPPMPGETPDSARMIEEASQMGQNPSIPFGREAMPTPTGQMTDAQRAVMSQSGSRMMPPTPEQQETMRRNAQVKAGTQTKLF